MQRRSPTPLRIGRCRRGTRTHRQARSTTNGSLTDRERKTLRRVVHGRRAEWRREGFAAATRLRRRMVARASQTSCWKCWRTIAFRQKAPSSTEWFYIPTNFTEPKWVKSIEVRPGNRAAVHHVLVYYRAKPDGKPVPIARANQKDQSNPPPDEPGVSEHPQRSDLKGMPQRLMATYAPGTNPQMAPSGTAFRLEPGGIIELQMHYTATGQPATDRTKIGLTFSTEPSPREVRAQHFMNMTMRLPAGASDVAVTTDLEFMQDATVWGLFPHTHLRGKNWAYTLELPNGENARSCRCRGTTSTGRRITCSRPRCRCQKDRKSSRPPGTTTRRRTRTIPIRRSTSSGVIRRGRKCSTPGYC